ncbi:uncharacterized protein TRIADDRAFT_51428 [Trichoplax adhaerens]|uniref:Lysosome-associated membrane glycoprotein 1 n=1 Tax=Trichoplax adhaerens TaxID=10228 RepID=B3RJ67_TRIAD|nr:hypothetical protein TRIADDRAFT_51428 [Trichoplax adhaerens]EDV29278.1 hypothetical protein TRIADDRAFT_51428 [Trichoplax adhaerens]|eukprot:XP_002108480.1 hypothetical protein TRIADDRAFT_51428 [Trichoplax adhaerens]
MNSFKSLAVLVLCCSLTVCFAADTVPATTVKATPAATKATVKATVKATTATAATATVDRLTIPTGFWNITNSKDQSCMLFQMGIRVNVFYKVPGSDAIHVFSSNVPTNASAEGTCQFNMTSSFSVMWHDNAVPPKLVDWWRTRSVKLNYKLGGIPDAMRKLALDNLLGAMGDQVGEVNSTYLEEVKALSHQSLICGTGYKLNFMDNKGNVDIVNVRAQPFDVVDNKFSFKLWYCVHDSPFAPKKDNTVPILVGSLITASFLITLLAYVFSRHRVRAGYQSM